MSSRLIVTTDAPVAQAHEFARATTTHRELRLTGDPDARLPISDIGDGIDLSHVVVMGFEENTAEELIAAAVEAWLNFEVALPNRAHGPKGRKGALIDTIVTAYDVTADMAGAWLEWGVTTLQMGLMSLEAPEIACILVSTWADGFSR